MNRGFVVAIISAGRAGQVVYPLAPDAIIVPPVQVGDYERALPGVQVVPQQGSGVSGARNTALDLFADQPLLQLDDDITQIQQFAKIGAGRYQRVTLTGEVLEGVIRWAFRLTAEAGGKVFGISPTNHVLYYSPKRAIMRRAFLNGSVSGYLPGCPWRFDEQLRLKEDYDFTLQSYAATGLAMRFDCLCSNARHRANSGGCADYRTMALEEECMQLLRQRWGPLIQRHPRRRGEIILQFPDDL